MFVNIFKLEFQRENLQRRSWQQQQHRRWWRWRRLESEPRGKCYVTNHPSKPGHNSTVSNNRDSVGVDRLADSHAVCSSTAITVCS